MLDYHKYIGCEFEKYFPGNGVYEGVVKSFDSHTKLYVVVYKDGDEEDFTPDQLQQVLQSSGSNKPYRLSQNNAPSGYFDRRQADEKNESGGLSAEEKEYFQKHVLHELFRLGWEVQKGKVLNEYYFVPPGVNPQNCTFRLGYDYFNSPEDVMKYVQNHGLLAGRRSRPRESSSTDNRSPVMMARSGASHHSSTSPLMASSMANHRSPPLDANIARHQQVPNLPSNIHYSHNGKRRASEQSYYNRTSHQREHHRNSTPIATGGLRLHSVRNMPTNSPALSSRVPENERERMLVGEKLFADQRNSPFTLPIPESSSRSRNIDLERESQRMSLNLNGSSSSNSSFRSGSSNSSEFSARKSSAMWLPSSSVNCNSNMHRVVEKIDPLTYLQRNHATSSTASSLKNKYRAPSLSGFGSSSSSSQFFNIAVNNSPPKNSSFSAPSLRAKFLKEAEVVRSSGSIFNQPSAVPNSSSNSYYPPSSSSSIFNDIGRTYDESKHLHQSFSNDSYQSHRHRSPFSIRDSQKSYLDKTTTANTLVNMHSSISAPILQEKVAPNQTTINGYEGTHQSNRISFSDYKNHLNNSENGENSSFHRVNEANNTPSAEKVEEAREEVDVVESRINFADSGSYRREYGENDEETINPPELVAEMDRMMETGDSYDGQQFSSAMGSADSELFFTEDKTRMYKNLLTEFYQTYCPRKMVNIDLILMAFRNRGPMLLRELREKYCPHEKKVWSFLGKKWAKREEKLRKQKYQAEQQQRKCPICQKSFKNYDRHLKKCDMQTKSEVLQVLDHLVTQVIEASCNHSLIPENSRGGKKRRQRDPSSTSNKKKKKKKRKKNKEVEADDELEILRSEKKGQRSSSNSSSITSRKKRRKRRQSSIIKMVEDEEESDGNGYKAFLLRRQKKSQLDSVIDLETYSCSDTEGSQLMTSVDRNKKIGSRNKDCRKKGITKNDSTPGNCANGGKEETNEELDVDGDIYCRLAMDANKEEITKCLHYKKGNNTFFQCQICEKWLHIFCYYAYGSDPKKMVCTRCFSTGNNVNQRRNDYKIKKENRSGELTWEQFVSTGKSNEENSSKKIDDKDRSRILDLEQNAGACFLSWFLNDREVDEGGKEEQPLEEVVSNAISKWRNISGRQRTKWSKVMQTSNRYQREEFINRQLLQFLQHPDHQANVQDGGDIATIVEAEKCARRCCHKPPREDSEFCCDRCGIVEAEENVADMIEQEILFREQQKKKLMYAKKEKIQESHLFDKMMKIAKMTGKLPCLTKVDEANVLHVMKRKEKILDDIFAVECELATRKRSLENEKKKLKRYQYGDLMCTAILNKYCQFPTHHRSHENNEDDSKNSEESSCEFCDSKEIPLKLFAQHLIEFHSDKFNNVGDFADFEGIIVLLERLRDELQNLKSRLDLINAQVKQFFYKQDRNMAASLAKKCHEVIDITKC